MELLRALIPAGLLIFCFVDQQHLFVVLHVQRGVVASGHLFALSGLSCPAVNFN